MRACIDHLEKTGRISARHHMPMIETEQWTIARNQQADPGRT